MLARTPNTFVVGAGPVATAMAGAMRAGGVPVLGLWARRADQARAAAAASGVAAYTAAPPDILLEADVVILAVRDDAIGEVAEKLLATGLVTKRHVLVHCSGAVSAAEAFADVLSRVGGVATLHPLRAIADGRADIKSLPGTVFGVEGDEVGRKEAMALASAIGALPLVLEGKQMAAYHAAAAMASNFVVALLDSAAGVLTAAGVEPSAALGALVPLAQGSLANVSEQGTDAGLTGPIRRGDHETVARHIQVLPEKLLPLYRVMGERTLAIARRIGDRSAEDLDRIGTLLAEPVDTPE